MKTTLTIFTLVTLMCSPYSFAQNFVEGQMPDTFLRGVRHIKFSPDAKQPIHTTHTRAVYDILSFLRMARCLQAEATIVPSSCGMWHPERSKPR